MGAAGQASVKAIQVAAGLVFRGGKVLITQRRAEDDLGGLWEFPGGKRKAGESYPEALRRELREELSIEVTVLDRLASVDHAYAHRTVHIEFFRCRWLDREPEALGCAQFAWITPDQLGQYQFPAADLRLVAQLRSQPKTWMD